MAHLIFTPLGYQIYTEMIFRDLDIQITCILLSPFATDREYFRLLLLRVLRLVRIAHGVAYRQRRAHVPGTEFLTEPRRRLFLASNPTVRNCCYVRNNVASP